jgi:hypothetical protein
MTDGRHAGRRTTARRTNRMQRAFKHTARAGGERQASQQRAIPPARDDEQDLRPPDAEVSYGRT